MAESKMNAIVRWLLGCVLSVGGAMVCSVVALWATHWLVRTLNPKTTAREYHSIVLRARGEPILKIGHPGAGYREEYRTLEGQPLSFSPSESQQMAKESFSADLHWYPQIFTSISHQSTRLISDTSWPWPWSQRTSLFTVQGQQGRHARSWFFVWPDHPGGTGYWVGYDILTKECLGYLGKSGLTASIPPVADQFPAWDAETRHAARISTCENDYGFPPSGQCSLPMNDERTEAGVLFVTPRCDAIYALNLTRGSVTAVRSVVPEQPLLGIFARDIGQSDSTGLRPKELVLVWPDRLEFTTPTLQSPRTVRLPEELRKESFSFAEQEGDTLVTSRLAERFRRGMKKKMWKHELRWINSKGEVTRRQDVMLPAGWIDELWDEEHFLSPLSLMPISLWRYVEMARSGLFPDDDWRPHRQPDEPMTWWLWWRCLCQLAHLLPWVFGLSLLSGVPFAIACWWRQRRVGASRFERLAWPVLVYFFGLAGWVAFVAHREWPRRNL